MARQINIDPSAGFCRGVEMAITRAEELLEEGKPVYSLGAMVHNNRETERLERLGIIPIDHSRLPEAGSAPVVFRAHGEPPETYRKAKEFGVRVIDATCPIVLKLQERIRRQYESMNAGREVIVIYGKKGHPETTGLIGQTGGEAILVTGVEDLEQVPAGKQVHLYSQTTMDPDGFREVEEGLKNRMKGSSQAPLEAHCTVCHQMKRRKPELKAFAERHDCLIFVSGKDSSNGKMLYSYAKSLNPDTHWISSPEEIESAWLQGNHLIGISGATSTPVWLLEKVRSYLARLEGDDHEGEGAD